jgi:Winged helix-turn helix
VNAGVGCLLELAKQLGNGSPACKMLDYSRDSFFRFKDLYDKGGELALQEISRKQPIMADLSNTFVGEAIEQAAHSTDPRGLGGGGEESIRLLGFIVGFAPGA